MEEDTLAKHVPKYVKWWDCILDFTHLLWFLSWSLLLPRELLIDWSQGAVMETALFTELARAHEELRSGCWPKDQFLFVLFLFYS